MLLMVVMEGNDDFGDFAAGRISGQDGMVLQEVAM